MPAFGQLPRNGREVGLIRSSLDKTEANNRVCPGMKRASTCGAIGSTKASHVIRREALYGRDWKSEGDRFFKDSVRSCCGRNRSIERIADPSARIQHRLPLCANYCCWTNPHIVVERMNRQARYAQDITLSFGNWRSDANQGMLTRTLAPPPVARWPPTTRDTKLQ